MTEQELKDKEAADRMKAFLAEKRNALCALGRQDIPAPEPAKVENDTGPTTL